MAKAESEEKANIANVQNDATKILSILPTVTMTSNETVLAQVPY